MDFEVYYINNAYKVQDMIVVAHKHKECTEYYKTKQSLIKKYEFI
jgi:hypothetical protein